MNFLTGERDNKENQGPAMGSPFKMLGLAELIVFDDSDSHICKEINCPECVKCKRCTPKKKCKRCTPVRVSREAIVDELNGLGKAIPISNQNTPKSESGMLDEICSMDVLEGFLNGSPEENVQRIMTFRIPTPNHLKKCSPGIRKRKYNGNAAKTFSESNEHNWFGDQRMRVFDGDECMDEKNEEN
jgi:hypothetical protein